MARASYEDYGISLNDITNSERCKRDLKLFVREFWDIIVPDPLDWNWHLTEICDLVQKVDMRAILKQEKEGDVIINVPPGMSKTTAGTILPTCWAFAIRPDLRQFIGSYSDSIVVDMADKIGIVMSSEKYQRYFPYVNIRKDKNNAHQFKTESNGEFFAFTVGGALMSKHADIIRVDDPINPRNAASRAGIDSVNRKFFDKTLPTRKTNKLITPIYVIMQRLTVDDPTNHLLSKAKQKNIPIHHLCLPAKVSNDVRPIELKEKYIDGYLDPKRLGERAIEELRVDMGTQEAEGQLQQNPVPEGGTIINKDWFKIVDVDEIPKEALRGAVNLYVDTALTDNTKNDPSGILCATFHNNVVYLLHYWVGHKLLNDLVHNISDIAEEWSDNRGKIIVEKKANGDDVINELSRIFRGKYNVFPIVPIGEKGQRLRGASPSIESGKYCILRGVWNRDFIDEVCGYGVLPHDESVDCLTMAHKDYFSEVKRERFTATA